MTPHSPPLHPWPRSILLQAVHRLIPVRCHKLAVQSRYRAIETSGERCTPVYSRRPVYLYLYSTVTLCGKVVGLAKTLKSSRKSLFTSVRPRPSFFRCHDPLTTHAPTTVATRSLSSLPSCLSGAHARNGCPYWIVAGIAIDTRSVSLAKQLGSPPCTSNPHDNFESL